MGTVSVWEDEKVLEMDGASLTSTNRQSDTSSAKWLYEETKDNYGLGCVI